MQGNQEVAGPTRISPIGSQLAREVANMNIPSAPNVYHHVFLSHPRSLNRTEKCLPWALTWASNMFASCSSLTHHISRFSHLSLLASHIPPLFGPDVRRKRRYSCAIDIVCIIVPLPPRNQGKRAMKNISSSGFNDQILLGHRFLLYHSVSATHFFPATVFILLY